uniref:Uncharacterized protein n=1 Tax=Acrobeloides nanus TaxID=290746 RepID=A0A914E9F5_9BILA
MKLNVDNDQKISILSGQIKPTKGPEEILTYNKENFSDRTVTLFYRLINKKQIINLQELGEPINNALGSIPNNATHIVTEIEYGLQIAITFSWDDDNLDKDLRNTLRELDVRN